VVELRLSVEVPEFVTLVGLRVAVSPVEGDTVAVRVTVPVNPFRAVTVMDEDPVPTFVAIVTDVGLAVTEKSVIVNVAVAVWTSEPLVPVIVSE
jgi:xanthine dehydrogenase iron-sulfur cluster and FAD-binding subunit A